MRHVLLAAAALLAPLPAAAQIHAPAAGPAPAPAPTLAPVPVQNAAPDWHRVATDDKAGTYVDLASITVEGDRVLATEVIVYRTHFQNTRVKRVTTYSEFDCPARRAHFIRMSFFGDNDVPMGEVDDPDKGEYRTVRPGSPAEHTMDFVCNTDRSGAVRIADPLTDEI